MSSPYRALLAVPGARRFVVAGLVGRMPMSMVGIGTVLLVSAVTGSYGTAGAVAATMSLAYAASAPLSARFADRYGQRRVLVPIACAGAAGNVLLIALAVGGAPVWTLFPAAAFAGAAETSLGAWVRARWSHVLRDRPERLHAAFSFESTVDEAIFVAGPLLVTALSTGVHPAAGLAASAVFMLTGSLALAAQRGTEPPPAPPAPGAARGSVLADSSLRVLVPVFLLLGTVFGAIDVSGVAFAEEQGHKALAGALLGCYALGSGTAALWYGARSWRAPLVRRLRSGLVLLAVLLVPPLLVDGLVPMMAVVFFSGLAISPTIIPGYGLVERLVPSARLTEGLALVSTTVGIGVALGSSLSGRLVDAFGARSAFLVPLGAACGAALLGLAGTRTISKRELSSRTCAE
ncbi:MFS transporter [Actinomadura parmotrematis]|uniref:MFS transporter n=1 Tax=Actinomadura parmotrematis TaxID=2864039 RepID=A0ABS7FWE9_9ACTN|nr:MFS transporter [Actinomadura parmotrematis]MBW8484747.1 MFS transporter [Actinomadura parmotrematis]